MKIYSIAGIVLAIAVTLGLTQVAMADRPDRNDPICNLPTVQHPTDHACIDELNTLFYTIGGADFANQRDPDRLMSKVCAADSKLHEGKPFDADQKLGNITTKIDGLLSDRKTKIDPADAEDIKNDVADAQTCILNNVGSF